jgi:cytidyltransferase-like protein
MRDAERSLPMRDGKIVVYVPMVADLFHTGHLRLLKAARSFGDWVIVGLVTDESANGYKRTPVIPYEQRAEILSDYADEIVPQDGENPTPNLKSDKTIDILIHADDWLEDYPAFAYMRNMGKKAMRVKYCPEQSTTGIIEEIIKRHEAGQKGY